jgi:Zn-dependent alcohol dehydrogenase
VVGADKIIGIDLNSGKRAMAEKFGMMHSSIRMRSAATSWCRRSSISLAAARISPSNASAMRTARLSSG